ncbi:MAG: ThiF family adenylyltransferase [Bacteroidales bacterium]|nr:ThiF family adenylyltransferase [Bacteroidales bacterium]
MENGTLQTWGKEVFDLLSWYKKETVQQASVMVVGAGALGNEALKNLALFGVGNIYIVDFDTIEFSNLTRSVLFRPEDADKGLYKAEVAAERIREINPQINVQCVCGHLASEVGLGLYRKMDVVIGCLDSRLARLQLNRLCMRANVPWIDGGIENLTGNVRIFRQNENCYECSLTEHAKQHISQQLSCAGVAQRNEQAGRTPTTPVIASIIGAIEVQEAMKLLHKKEVDSGLFTPLTGKWLHYEGMHNRIAVYDNRSFDEDCPSHECWNDVFQMSGLSAGTRISDAFSLIRRSLNVNEVEINLRNDKFVDVIVSRNDNQRFTPMLPESKIPDYIDQNYDLYTRPRTELNQNTYENIDRNFPYKRLTLKEIGIPYYDIIEVTTEHGLYHIELTGDAGRYPFIHQEKV